MPKKKYDVKIMITRLGNTFDTSYDIPAGQMTETQMKDYLAQLSNKPNIPETSCLRRMFANMDIDTTAFLSSDSKEKNNFIRYCGHLNIFSLLKSTSICTAKNCARKIKNGKCTDPFVIETIGKKFFADKYKGKQK